MKKWIGSILILVISGILVGTVVIPAIAQGGGEADIPNTIGYQGYLTDKDDQPIETPVNIRFALYTAATSGTQVWTETHNGVDPNNGLFTVELGGSGTPILTSHLTSDRWLSVKVGTDAEMTPRQKLASVAFALRAQQANNAYTLGGNQPGFYVATTGDTMSGTLTIQNDLIVQGDTSISGTTELKDNLYFNNVAGGPYSIYFKPDESSYVRWHDTAPQKLDISHDLMVYGDSRILGNLEACELRQSGTRLFINSGGPDRNSRIYFHEDGLDNGEYLGWRDANDTFFFSDDLWTSDSLYVDGESFLGNSGSDMVHLMARVASPLIPASNNLYDIGSTASRWHDLFIDDISIYGNLSVAQRYYDSSSEAGTSGQLLSSTGTGTRWIDISSGVDSDWIVSGSDMYASVPGNVGIGTTSPDKKLHISGDALVTDDIFVNSTGGGYGSIHYGNRGLQGSAPSFDPDNNNDGLWIEGNESSEGGGIFMNGNTMCLWSPGDNGLLRVYDEDDFSSPKFVIDNGGKVGIGTVNPETTLDVHGVVQAYSYRDSSLQNLIRSSDASVNVSEDVDGSWNLTVPPISDLDWTISGTSMYSAVSGNVGIGVIYPNEKLDVNGDVRFRDNVYLGGITDAAIHYGDTGLFGEAASYTRSNGLWIEAGNGAHFGSGIYMNANTMCLWSPGAGDLFKVYDEDSLGTPAFSIAGNGNIGITGSISNTDGNDINIFNDVYIDGELAVNGNLSKASGSFKIDHPLDPENKYLYHSFVESPDMMNVYNGNVILDANGEAVVELPDWFEALNKDFRYQLTCLGGFAPVYVAEEVFGNQFRIAGGEPGMKVSWQVTGVRQDDWANENRIQVEVDKTSEETGLYLYPEAAGVDETHGISYQRTMEQLKTK